MLLILLSWIYILFSTINLGFGLDKMISLKNKNFVVTSILGLFIATIFGSIWAIFGRINIEFHLVLLLINGFLFFKFKKPILEVYYYLSLRLAQSRHRDCAGLAADSASLSGRRRRRGSAAWQRRWRQPRLGL